MQVIEVAIIKYVSCENIKRIWRLEIWPIVQTTDIMTL